MPQRNQAACPTPGYDRAGNWPTRSEQAYATDGASERVATRNKRPRVTGRQPGTPRITAGGDTFTSCIRHSVGCSAYRDSQLPCIFFPARHTASTYMKYHIYQGANVIVSQLQRFDFSSSQRKSCKFTINSTEYYLSFLFWTWH